MLAGIVLIGFLTLVGYYLAIVAPRERAAAAEADVAAQTFKRLQGSARYVAMYDAFAKHLDDHYFDQQFRGFDWPRLRSEWRAAAARSSSDNELYSTVLFQVAQRFPVSHVGAIPPARRRTNTAARKNKATKWRPCSDVDRGFSIVWIRRGKSVFAVVGDVWPGSIAAEDGVTPGFWVEKFEETINAAGGRIYATLVRLSAEQMHTFEATGSFELADTHSAGEELKRLKKRVRINYPCGRDQPLLEVRRLPGGVLYIRFDEFNKPLVDEVKAALEAAGSKGAVLDLRGNSGGHAHLLLNALMPRNRPLYRRRLASGLRTERSDLWTRKYDGPLVVLIGPASSSAAEITAAILGASGRALTVGRRTKGSVLGARFYPLPDGGQVQVPVEDAEMLDGSRLEGVGVAPIVEVYPTVEQLRAGEDPALKAAMRELERGRARSHRDQARLVQRANVPPE